MKLLEKILVISNQMQSVESIMKVARAVAQNFYSNFFLLLSVPASFYSTLEKNTLKKKFEEFLNNSYKI